MDFRSFAIRCLRFGVPFLLLFLAALALVVWLAFDSLAQFGLRAAGQELPGRLRVKRFSLSPWGVQLQDVNWTLGETEPFFRADRIEVTGHPGALLRRDWEGAVRSITVVEPGLRVVVDAQGEVNLQQLWERSSSAPSWDWSALRGDLRFENGWILYSDRRRSGFLYQLTDWNGRLELPDGERCLMVSRASRKEDASQFLVEGEVSLADPRLTVSVGLQKLDLLPFAGFPGWGPGLTLLEGELGGSAVVQGKAETWAELPGALYAVGKMRLSQGLIASPWLPVDLTSLQGEVALLGREASTQGFEGEAGRVPFRVEGSARLDDEDVQIQAKGSLKRFALERIRPWVDLPEGLDGQVEGEFEAEGPLQDLAVTGIARAYDLTFQDQTLSRLVGRFLRVQDMLHFWEVVATTVAGEVKGEGWLFTQPKPRVLLALEGVKTQPSELLPDLAKQADFQVRLAGSLEQPVLWGHGKVEGLGTWAQGVDAAQGSFFLKGQDLLLWDGSADAGQSRVRVPVASVDVARRQVEGMVATTNFQLGDLPASAGLSGAVSGQALVQADLSRAQPQLWAQGILQDGTVSYRGQTASQMHGRFALDGQRLRVPEGRAQVLGGQVEVAAELDLQTQTVVASGRGAGLSLQPFGLPGRAGEVLGSVSGSLSGDLGIYGYADSDQGRMALSAFQQPDGRLGGVAWVDGAIPEQPGGRFEGLVVAGGALPDLKLDYLGQAIVPSATGLGPLAVHGSAQLRGRVLTLQPTVLTALGQGDTPTPASVVTYRGAAYPFFGPLLAGPLEKIVVQEYTEPHGPSLSVRGQADLGKREVDLRFQVRATQLEELAQATAWSEALPFQIRSGFGWVTGSLRGTFLRPELQATYHLPWLLLSQGEHNRKTLSSRGLLSWRGEDWDLASAVVSEVPFDPRLHQRKPDPLGETELGAGLLSMRGRLEAQGAMDLKLASSGFDAGFLALVLPEPWHAYLPYGRIATQDLRASGTLAEPSLVGELHLVHGGLFWKGEGFPFHQASVSLESHRGDLKLEELRLEAPGVSLRGEGTLSREGRVQGRLAAQDLDLKEFHRLGRPWSGFGGRVDAALSVEGRLPHAPNLTLAAVGHQMTWDPSAIGGLAQVVPIEELALGRLHEDGQSVAQGLTATWSRQGWTLHLPERGARFRLPDGGLSLEAEGTVRFPGGLPDLQTFKTFMDWNRYFRSPQGPDFGDGEAAFRLRAPRWTFAEMARLLGRSAPPYNASGATEVSLQGQWWRDHARQASGALPHYVAEFSEVVLEGRQAGLALAEPTRLRYQRDGEAGFLSLEDLRVSFFQDVPSTQEPSAEGQASALERRQQGSLEAEGQLAVTQLPEAAPRSWLTLSGRDIPLGNLDFLLPDALSLDGLVESLEVVLDGPLPQPQLSMTAVVERMAFGPLQNMTMRGRLTGGAHEDGSYLLSLGTEQEPGFTLGFGPTAEESESLVKAEGSAQLQWQRATPWASDHLDWATAGLELSMDSPIDLAAWVVDKNLRILADVVPGKESARGEFSATLAVNGTLGYPQFEGLLSLNGGVFRSDNYGSFEGVEIDARLERIPPEEAEPSAVLEALSSGLITRLSLPRFEGTLGKKPFFAGGKAEFAGIAPTFLNLFFVGESLPLQLPDLFTGHADVDFEVRGRYDESSGTPRLTPTVLGTVVIPRGDFYVPIGAVQGANPKLPLPLDYDIAVDLGNEFYAHMLSSQVRAVGTVRLVSEAGQPKLYGRVDLSRGQIRIPFYDASFRVRQGTAYFEGSTIPRLEAVEALADLGGFRIVARVDGTYPDALSVNLFSDPPLPQAELSRLVVLGGLPSSFSGLNDPNQGGSSLDLFAGGGVSFLSGILTNRLTEQIGRLFLLSEVSFDFIPPASYVIKLAKALDPDDTFLLTLTRVIRDNGLNENLYGVEWRFSQTLLTRLALDQFNRMRFWLQSINRF